MRKTSNIIIFFVTIFVITLFLFFSYVSQIVANQAYYKAVLSDNINQYLQQQFYTLKRLGNNLIPAIKSQDKNTIATNIIAYEEILYGLSKQNLAVAANIYLVSFNAPQTIISGYGTANNAILAPDSAYYNAAMETSNELAISRSYINSEMPDYPMINFGIAIEDKQANYYGQLDMKIALLGLQDYLSAQMAMDFKENNLFNFKLNSELRNPTIVLDQSKCWLQCFYFVIMRLLVIAACCLLLWSVIALVKKNRNYKVKISTQIRQTNNAELKLAALSQAIMVQHKYGEHQTAKNQNIYLKQLLQDVLTVNAVLALERNITINIPALLQDNLAFYGNKVTMMQILSGILHEIILQLNPSSTITVQVSVVDLQAKSKNIIFSFEDNGFYDKLQQREVTKSVADIRCSGWQNLLDLIAQEDGLLNYTHTAYEGNQISLHLQREIVTNVVQLDAYYDYRP